MESLVKPRYPDALRTRKKCCHNQTVAVNGVRETYVYKSFIFYEFKTILNLNLSCINKQLNNFITKRNTKIKSKEIKIRFLITYFFYCDMKYWCIKVFLYLDVLLTILFSTLYNELQSISVFSEMDVKYFLILWRQCNLLVLVGDFFCSSSKSLSLSRHSIIFETET